MNEKPTIVNEEIEDAFNNFWANIILNEDGSINMDQLKFELFDFLHVIENVPIVYCHVTGGQLSKPLYNADVVIGEFNRYVEDLSEEHAKECLDDFKAEINACKTLEEVRELCNDADKEDGWYLPIG